jgi:transcriptional regulator with XRE-family HTH domain
MSQGEIEKRTGLLRCYISRVENGHTVPNVDILEKMARALEAPLYRLFTADGHVKKSNIRLPAAPSCTVNTKEDRELWAFAKLLSRMDDKKRGLLLHMASKMANTAEYFRLIFLLTLSLSGYKWFAVPRQFVQGRQHGTHVRHDEWLWTSD